jgi:rod shape-determining protein MreD
MISFRTRSDVLGRRRTAWQIYGVPVGSVMVGSLMSALPIIAHSPVLPPLGLLMLLGWRLLRPELWPAWIGIPLGLFDDMLSGQPIGSAIALWSIALLAIEGAERRLIWRDFAHDWALAAVALGFCIAGGWLFIYFQGFGGPLITLAPQMVASALLYPTIARLCNLLDRWRLP